MGPLGQRRAARALAVALAAGSVALACGSSPRAPAPRSAPPSPAPVELVIDERAEVWVHVPAQVMGDDVEPADPLGRRAEDDRRRVRESARDLVRVLGAITGARVTVATEPPPGADGGAVRVVLGEHAEAAFGPVGLTAPHGQAFRLVTRGRTIALYGESGLATSYAIYELLDRLGCRWFFPGPLGEVLAPRAPVRLAPLDERRAPSTIYRGVWYADADWKRRNRQGGLLVDAGHALELRYVTKEDRAAHPEWAATVKGAPHPSRLKWSSPSLAKHVADRVLELRAKEGAPSYSLSPDDGTDFDESPEDRALDAGDRDPTMGTTSLTDRFLVLANRVAGHVAEQDPELLLGFLAYVQYTRPPVREPVHPNLVPQIAPITYARAHPMNDDRVPGNVELRRAIEGWGAKSKGTSIYFYGWFLSEPVAPNPMLTKWGHDVPYVLAHNARYWQPETFPNFESSMHALYLGMRLAFDARLHPDAVFDDLDARLYGHAGPAMHAYWRYVDRVWIDTPEYSGREFGHARRFTPERLARMRELLDAAKAAAVTDAERRRVELADDSLSLFEDFMRMRRDFLEGRFAGLSEAGEAYKARATALGEKWQAASAFAKTPWAPETVYARYFATFQEPAYRAAARIATTHQIDSVQRIFRYRREDADAVDPSVTAPGFDDSSWKSTDVAVESWSALGLHDHFGSMWYRATVPGKRSPRGKRAFLFFSDVDGAFRVFVNGGEARHVPEHGGPKTPDTFARPLTFEVTSLLRDGDNVLAVHATRKTLNELGLGGLIGPVVLYRER